MITFPKVDGCRLLCQKIEERLPAGRRFTLREAVDALEGIATTYCIEETDAVLWHISRKRREGRRRVIEILLAWQLHPQGEFFEACEIHLSLTVPLGFWSFLYSDETFGSEQFEEPQVANFFGWAKYLRHYRWLGDRMPLEAKIELKEHGPEEFFEMAKRFIPMLIEKGLWKCEGPSCPVGHEPVLDMTRT